ncbi:MAG TPA: DUF177 domain-containing protein [Woeseiaceae bacterium]|jgi:uncharacterized metal-binding protein YceD (DUF177 family)|nr:DUF177 domain-containing protein [Woeseiaceae bacterium]
MGNPLRDRRTAAEWAAGSQVIEFADKLSNFEQLSVIVEADLAALADDRLPAGWRDAVVAGRLEFGFADAQRTLPCVTCRVTTTVDAVCQRCLNMFELPLQAEVDLLLLGFDQDADGYDEFEVWELEDRFLRPQDIVEELLIMAMPLAAMHTESAACKVLSSGEDVGAEEMTTPFAALREQMAQDNEG